MLDSDFIMWAFDYKWLGSTSAKDVSNYRSQSINNGNFHASEMVKGYEAYTISQRFSLHPVFVNIEITQRRDNN